MQIKVEFGKPLEGGGQQVDAVNRKEVLIKNMRKKTEMLLSTNTSLVSPAFREGGSTGGFMASRMSTNVGERENFNSVYTRTRTIQSTVRTPAVGQMRNIRIAEQHETFGSDATRLQAQFAMTPNNT